MGIMFDVTSYVYAATGSMIRECSLPMHGYYATYSHQVMYGVTVQTRYGRVGYLMEADNGYPGQD